jgi:hypothetical protein
MFLLRSRTYTCLYASADRPSFSTRRDVAITCAITRHAHLGINLLSIRSSGCRSRIVLLTESNHSFDADFRRIVALTQTEIFYFVWNKSMYRHTDLARILWFYEWLVPREVEIDRVFWFDAFDVFFQSDPFRTLVAPDMMTFISEEVRIKNEPVNYGWIQNCFGRQGAERVKYGRVICFGTVGGASSAFVKFLRFLVGNRTQWFSCLIDQAQLNYYVHGGFMERNGIKYQIQGCNGTVLSLSFCPRMKVHFQHQGNWFFEASSERGRVTPAAVHHYKDLPAMVRNFYRRCWYGLVSL